MIYEPQVVVYPKMLVVRDAIGFVIQRGKVRQFCSSEDEARAMFAHAVRDLTKEQAL